MGLAGASGPTHVIFNRFLADFMNFFGNISNEPSFIALFANQGDLASLSLIPEVLPGCFHGYASYWVSGSCRLHGPLFFFWYCDVPSTSQQSKGASPFDRKAYNLEKKFNAKQNSTIDMFERARMGVGLGPGEGGRWEGGVSSHL